MVKLFVKDISDDIEPKRIKINRYNIEIIFEDKHAYQEKNHPNVLWLLRSEHTKSWVEVAEEQAGKRADAVDIEVNKELTLNIVFESPKSLGVKGKKPDLT